MPDPVSDQEQFLTHQFCGQPMSTMVWTPTRLPATGLSDNELSQSIVTLLDPDSVVCPTLTKELQSQLGDRKRKTDQAGSTEFELFEVKDLITQKNEKIETLELEI